MLWLAALSRVNDLRLMPGVLSGLGLVVWLIYLLDRLVDAWGAPVGSLSLRHQFYYRFRWPILLGVLPLGLAWLAWLALWVVPVGLLAHSVVQLLPILLYLVLYTVTSRRARSWLIQGGVLIAVLLVNLLPLPLMVRTVVSIALTGATALVLTLGWHEKVGRFFRKEVAAGLLFAVGCTTWTRFHTLGSEGPDIWAELILLGLLFISNLTLITAREEPGGEASASTSRGAIFITLASLVAIPLEYLPATLLPLVLAVLAGLVGLEILWRKHPQMSAEAFRVWADVIVALPAMALLLAPASWLG